MAYANPIIPQHFTGQDAVIVDVPVGTPDFAWPTAPHHPSIPYDHPLSFEYDDTSLSMRPSNRSPTPPPQPQPVQPVSDLPRFPRTRPMPLHAQLGHLQNPYRPASSSSRIHKLSSHPLELCDLSLEVADLVQVILQTMLHVSPPQILDSVKEQISACSLSLPLPSVSAILTALKNLNFISANASTLCSHHQKQRHTETLDPTTPLPPVNDFDLGDLLQSVGDAVSGVAAEAGVDFVLYHGDYGTRHARARGNEGGILYLLTHVLYQILSTAHQGDRIELGIFVLGTNTLNGAPSLPTDTKNDQDGQNHSSALDDLGGRLQYTFHISHNFSNQPNGISRKDCQSDACEEVPPQPSLSSNLLRGLLHQTGATLTPDPPSSKLPTVGRTWEIVMPLDSGSSSVAGTPVTSSIDIHKDSPPVEEPTLEQLSSFLDSLKGRRVTFYTKPDSSFSQHMSSYMSSWGMEIAHVSPSDDPEAEPPPVLSTKDAQLKYLQATGSNISTKGDPKPSEPSPAPVTIMLIDDNITILQERLQRMDHSSELRKRPSLASHHRPRSSPQVPRGAGQSSTQPLHPSIILYFTSLGNYKATKDLIHWITASSNVPMPEVMLIPKPVGPRRLLTVLYAATMKPPIDPLFTPTAALPSTLIPMPMPTVTAQGETPPASKTPNSKGHRPTNSRSNSDHSLRTIKMEGVNVPTPSPRGSEHVEFLSDAAVQLGTTIKSGLWIHSPDAAGVFFHPRGKPQRNLSGHVMERDRGQSGEERHQTTASRLPFAGDGEVVVFTPSSSGAKSSPPGAKPDQPIAVTAVVKKVATPRSDIPVLKPPPITPRKTILHDNPTVPVKPPSLIHTGAVVAAPKPASPPAKPEKKALRKLISADGKSGLELGGKKGSKKDDNKIVPPINVLIVDDNPINQTLLSTFMTRKRIRFDQARNGQEAVEKWRTGEFHLILMDIQMPIMNGIEATQEIRRLEKVNARAGYLANSPFMEELQQQTPVHTPSDTSTESDSNQVTSPHRSAVIIVALTASTLEMDRLAALSAGCNDYLTKPVSLHWLNNKIVEWGSIKALQMWSDPRSDVLRGLSAAQAKNVADRLHLVRRTSTSGGSRTDASYSNPNAAAINGSTSSSTGVNDPKQTSAGNRARRASASGVTTAADFNYTYRLLQISTASQPQPIISTAQAIAGLMTPSETPAENKLFTQVNGVDGLAHEIKHVPGDEDPEEIPISKELHKESEMGSPTTPTPISVRRIAAAAVSEQFVNLAPGLLSPPPDMPESNARSPFPGPVNQRPEFRATSPEEGSPRPSNSGTGEVPSELGSSRSHTDDSQTGAPQTPHSPNETNGTGNHTPSSPSGGGEESNSGSHRWHRRQGH